MAISAMGNMIVQPGSKFINNYPSAWKVWASRCNDVNPQVRLLWLGYLPALLEHQPEHVAEHNRI
jgi:predicted choloylglycine hydrolase